MQPNPQTHKVMLTNDNKKALAGTVIFHGLLLLALLYLGFSTPLPLPGEEGVEVNLGFSDQGLGTSPSANVAQPASSPAQKADQGQVMSSPDPESVALADKGKNKKDEKPVEEKKKPEETKPSEPVVNTNALYKGKTNGNANASQGIAGGQGDQGKPNGNPNSNNYTGTGQGNSGVSFNLTGRGKVYLNEPPYNSQEQGRVVVEIIVDRQGNVIRAVAGKRIPDTNIGTTVTDQGLWKVAREAALKSKFTPDPAAVEEQKGYITYNFIRVN